MSEQQLPGTYTRVRERHTKLAHAIDELGKAVKQEGPINEKNAHLIQLAGAVANRSEGAVHSHVRQALDAGADVEEIHHAIILLTSTIGFPAVMAALSWVEDLIGDS